MTARTEPLRLQHLSPAVLAKLRDALGEKMRLDRIERDAFIAGPTFQRLLSTFRETSQPVCVEFEDLAYQREGTLARLGWLDVACRDVDLFVATLLSPDADTVEPGTRQSDEGCPFFNATFRHYGLTVWMMSGQGTVWSISNQQAAEQTASA